MHSDEGTTPIKILIVEDHQVTRMGLRMVLEQVSPFAVVGDAENGAQAIEQVESLKPDVVLMDIAMPVMDGIEATQVIKQNYPEVKVLVLTESEEPNNLFASLSAGADGYATKDCNATLLASAISTVASGGIWLDPVVAKEVVKLIQSRRPVSARIDSSGVKRAPETQFRLSSREQDILKLLVQGLSNQQMAAELGLSSETVKTHMRHIMDKLKVSDRTQAAVKALKHGLVDRPQEK